MRKSADASLQSGRCLIAQFIGRFSAAARRGFQAEVRIILATSVDTRHTCTLHSHCMHSTSWLISSLYSSDWCFAHLLSREACNSSIYSALSTVSCSRNPSRVLQETIFVDATTLGAEDYCPAYCSVLAPTPKKLDGTDLQLANLLPCDPQRQGNCFTWSSSQRSGAPVPQSYIRWLSRSEAMPFFPRTKDQGTSGSRLRTA